MQVDPYALRRRRTRAVLISSLCCAALLFGCTATSDAPRAPSATGTSSPSGEAVNEASLPAAPPVPRGAVAADVENAIKRIVPSLQADALDTGALDSIAASGDARLAWMLSDIMRFSSGTDHAALGRAFTELTGATLGGNDDVWRQSTDLLIYWDTPAPANYRRFKSGLFLALEPRWNKIFNDPNADIDWRFLSWGGVLPDDRKLGDLSRCIRGCIPALDDPPLTSATTGNWYPDDRFVFGVTVNGEHVAFPKNIMEVHEMVNLTIGNRRIAMPYCTLCGSAQAFFTDRVPGAARPLVLRTSGLLSLSNKVMYDLETGSAFDTFRGRAVSGPLHDAVVTLPMLTTVVSRWGDWRRAHPDTRIVGQSGGGGEDYPLDPLQGRDDSGPIFPIRRSDTRLGVHTQVLGVVAPDGTSIGFPVEAARTAIEAGKIVRAHGVTLTTDGGGLHATADGSDVPSHQAFWFAWAQFHPGTELWTAPG